MSTYDTFKKANNKGADQNTRMRRLVYACVVRKLPKTGFLASRPMYVCMTVCGVGVYVGGDIHNEARYICRLFSEKYGTCLNKCFGRILKM